jgi:hypothetical protein
MQKQTVESYLAQVRDSLWLLPTTRRVEEVNELRQHLEALIARFAADGQTPEAAEQAAIHTFGTPTHVSRRLALVWWRGGLRGWAQSNTGMALFLGIAVLYGQNFLNRYLVPGVLTSAPLLLWWMWPIGVSLLVGYWQPKRALAVVPAAFLVKAICVAIDILGVPLLQSGIRHRTGIGHALVLSNGFWVRNAFPLCVEGLTDMLLGLSFASIGMLARRLTDSRGRHVSS